jgi:hypothetical protein
MLQNIKTLWKSLADSKSITAVNVIQYGILRALATNAPDKITIAKRILRRSFTPVTRQVKLANGHPAFNAMDKSVNNASSFIERYNRTTYKWEKSPALMLGVPSNELLTPEEIEEYNTIYDAVRKTGAIARHYSYFFTRQDIFNEYQLVQTAHVALELGNKLPPEAIKDLHFTVCGVPDLEALRDVQKLLETWNAPHVVFREPDIGNQLTSIGVYPVAEHKRGVLKSYNLLRFNR